MLKSGVENFMMPEFFIQTYSPSRFSLFLSLSSSPAVGLDLFLFNFVLDSYRNEHSQRIWRRSERGVKSDFKVLK